jgi:glutamyl-tRNA synthetase
VPLVLNASGAGKLSKRKTVDKAGQPIEQMTLVREFRAAGYLPEAMFNYLALLGWTYSGDEDVFSRAQAIERFRIEDIHPSPAAWNPEKLDWMNGEYIRRLDPGDLAERMLPFLRAAGLPAEVDEVRRMVPLVQERLTTLSDAVEWLAFFWADAVHPAPAELVPRKMDAAGAVQVLDAASEALASVDPWDHDTIEPVLRGMAERMGLSAGAAFQPLRVAVTGQRVAPPLFESLVIIGRATTLARIAAARALLT